MSFIKAILALFSKKRRLNDDLEKTDRKIAQINKLIDKQAGNTRGREASKLLAQRTALIQERTRLLAELAGL